MEQLEFDIEETKPDYEALAMEALSRERLSTCEENAQEVIANEGNKKVYTRLAYHAASEGLDVKDLAWKLGERGFGGIASPCGGRPDRTNRTFANEFYKIVVRREMLKGNYSLAEQILESDMKEDSEFGKEVYKEHARAAICGVKSNPDYWFEDPNKTASRLVREIDEPEFREEIIQKAIRNEDYEIAMEIAMDAKDEKRAGEIRKIRDKD
tara:strand:+ start:50 stop:682 length:633 start_codon:yes stop_codon:yes gene_type:complete